MPIRVTPETIRRAVIVFAIIVRSSAVASGQARTDVVTLANGDRITGEIIDLDRGRLEVKTDDAGTIDIEWERIARVQASRRFEVATSDGRRLLGSLGPTVDRFVLVVDGNNAVSLSMPEVTEIRPIGASFWAKLDGSADAGFSYTRSSGVAQTTLNTDAYYRRPAFLLRLTTSATLTEQSDDSKRDSRADAELSYSRYRGQRWFVAGLGRVETNESMGLVLRTQLGTMAGLRLVNSNHAQLEIGGGIDVNDEKGVDSDRTQNVEGLFVFRTSYYTYDRPKTNFDASVQYYPSLSTWGRQRLQTSSSVKRELFKDFYVGLNVYDTFDSAPPNPDAARNDVGVTASVGWSY